MARLSKRRRQEPAGPDTSPPAAAAAGRPPRRRAQPARVPSPWWQSPWAWGSGVLALVAVVVAVIIVVGLAGGPGTSTATSPPPASVLRAVTGVSPGVSSSVGAGGIPNPLQPAPGSPSPLSASKPELVFVGADSCPYCAAERWAMVVALSRFGSFEHLGVTTSSSTDVYPNTHTFTFYGATYTSPYVTFTAFETADRAGNALQTPTARVQELVTTYDPPSSSCPSGACIPFQDLDNRYILLGSAVSPQLLHGMTWKGIAATLGNPRSPVAKAIIGDANWITAGVCRLTADRPASACSAAPIPTLEGQLGST